jgi:hypothetical protein
MSSWKAINDTCMYRYAPTRDLDLVCRRSLGCECFGGFPRGPADSLADHLASRFFIGITPDNESRGNERLFL